MTDIAPYRKPGIERRMKPVNQYDLNGTFIQRYKSMTEAAKMTGVAHSAIVQCCKGRRLSAGNSMFQYA